MPFYKFLVFVAIVLFAALAGWSVGELFKSEGLAVVVSAILSFAGINVLMSGP